MEYTSIEDVLGPNSSFRLAWSRFQIAVDKWEFSSRNINTWWLNSVNMVLVDRNIVGMER